ncbi:MAG: hypothetical protein AAF587_30670 [Bacteroidota bacterium]
MKHLIYICSILFLIPGFVSGQDSTKWEVSGSLRATVDAYWVNGIQARRDPFNFRLAGNPVVSYGDFRIPMGFVLGNYTSFFNQPYNRFGLSPSYKWITVHLGYRNLTYSPVTLNGHTFLGAGIDLTPGPLRIGALYGTFQRSLPFDSLRNALVQFPSFQRKGYAAKVGVGSKKNHVDLILMQMEDEPLSLNYDSLGNVLPGANTIVGLSSRFQVGKFLEFKGDVGANAFVRDLKAFSFDLPSEAPAYVQLLDRFLQPNASIYFTTALKSSLTYRNKATSFSLNYDRIDPDYLSMGSYFFRNDVESFYLMGRLPLAKRKLRIVSRIGVERNNLRSGLAKTTRRALGFLMLHYIPSGKWNFNAHYSNFQNRQIENFRLRSDTSLIVQVSQNAYVGAIRTLRTANNIHRISGRVGFRDISDVSGFAGVARNETRTYNAHFRYKISWRRSGFALQPVLTWMQFENFLNTTEQFRYSLMLQKRFAKNRLSSSLTTTWITTEQTQSNGTTLNLRGTLSWRITDKQSLMFNTYYLRNQYTGISGIPSFSEWRGTVNVMWNL